MPGLIVPFTTFTILYVGLAVAVVALMRRHVLASPTSDELARIDVGEVSDGH